MNNSDVIDSYVADVTRRVGGRERNEIGLELRGLLTEMLAERAAETGRPADDEMVLAMLKEFGAPAEIAARYRSPGMVIIPAEQTKSFALLSIAGVGLQWALTLPQVFAGQSLTAWWLSWGLGAFWWPGLMAMLALIAAGLGQIRSAPAWRPRNVDPERIVRARWIFGLVWFAIGAAFMTALPWLARLAPEPLSSVFAFDPEFLRQRAPWVLLLWAAAFAVRAMVLSKGRWSVTTKRLDAGVNLAFVALLGWWLAVGDMFQAPATDDGARSGLTLVIVLILLDMAYKLYRQRASIRAPKTTG